MLRRYIRNLDWILILTVFLLTGVGLVLIASATHTEALRTGVNYFVQRQGLFLAVDVLLVILLLRLDYHVLKQVALPLYVITLILLLGVMFFGHSTMGAQRWIRLGPVIFQPSEFSKVFIIVCLAAFLDKQAGSLEHWKEYLPAGHRLSWCYASRIWVRRWSLAPLGFPCSGSAVLKFGGSPG